MINRKDIGVSPVIGVVLMVAVTVALVALVTVTVFDIGDDVSEPADISVSTEVDAGNDEIDIEVVRNENVDSLKVSGAGSSYTADTSGDLSQPDGDGGDIELGIGEENVGTATIKGDSDTDDVTEGGSLDVVATVGENEEIVTTIDASLEDTSGP